MWSVTSSLISAGVRNTHPNIIVNLFNSLIIPKLLYGMEIVRLSNSDIIQIEAQARSCLKSLFGISKHSKNLINKMYEIPNISSLIEKRQILLLTQLLKMRPHVPIFCIQPHWTVRKDPFPPLTYFSNNTQITTATCLPLY